MNDRPYNAANRKDIRAAEKQLVAVDTIHREVITGIMSVTNGRYWMYELLGFTQAYADPFTPDPYAHAYHAGRKALGTKLHNDIMLYAPKQYETMLKEAYERSITADTRRNVRANDADTESDYDPTVPSDAAYDYADAPRN